MITTNDAILGGLVTLRQPKSGYRVAIDPILLAAAAPVRSGQGVLDLGCGTGAVGLCLARLVPDVKIWGLERNQAMAALARDNVQANGFANRFQVLDGDLLDPPPDLPRHFDHVLANPPYDLEGQATPARAETKRAAHQARGATLDDWFQVAKERLVEGGRATFVLRAQHKPGIESFVQRHAMSCKILPLAPNAGQPPKRLLLCLSSQKPGSVDILEPLVLHDPDHSYVAGVEDILRGRCRLDVFIDEGHGSEEKRSL